MDGWMDGWTDGWMDGWMDGWTDGRMDGWLDGSAPVKEEVRHHNSRWQQSVSVTENRELI